MAKAKLEGTDVKNTPSVAEKFLNAVREKIATAKQGQKKRLNLTLPLPLDLPAQQYKTLREGLEAQVNAEEEMSVCITIQFPLEKGETSASTYIIENSVAVAPKAVVTEVKKRVAEVVPSNPDEDAALAVLKDDSPRPAAGDRGFELAPEVRAELDAAVPSSPAQPKVTDSGEAAKAILKENEKRRRELRKTPQPQEKPSGHGWKLWKYITG